MQKKVKGFATTIPTNCLHYIISYRSYAIVFILAYRPMQLKIGQSPSGCHSLRSNNLSPILDNGVGCRVWFALSSCANIDRYFGSFVISKEIGILETRTDDAPFSVFLSCFLQ